MAELIIDTNVLLVAKGDSTMSWNCVEACTNLLDQVFDHQHIVVIDDNYILLEEYENNCLNPYYPPNYANRFLRWLWTNQSNPSVVKQVTITPTGHKDFEEFPESLRKEGFDLSDRKFVAVAAANNFNARIVQAADSKWIGWHSSLVNEGVSIFLPCEKELRAIHARKQK